MCVICKGRNTKNYNKVGVWASTNISPTSFGLGTTNEKGEVCCSFREGWYKTREEAEEAARETSIEEVIEERGGYNEDDNGDYGPPDSDPYDREPMQY